MLDVLTLIARRHYLFGLDIEQNEQELSDTVKSSRFLVLGGAGSIGKAVTKELFKRNPKKLHVVDLNENNLVELVRDLRSSIGYIKGDFKSYALDIGTNEYDAFIKADGQYDYVLNLSALKHVRSEKDQFTLMRLINVNILNPEKTIRQSIAAGVKKYFCVSTDKAANPVSIMGASKQIMEMFLAHYGKIINISTARFANVAFSDGSLLYSFQQRLANLQPIVAPSDVKRYFVTSKEAGELCLLSCILGKEHEIFFPKLDETLHLQTFKDIAIRFLKANNYDPVICINEDEARLMAKSSISKGKWPCLFVSSDTTGEKECEEFYVRGEPLDLDRFEDIGIVFNRLDFDVDKLNSFREHVNRYLISNTWTKQNLLDLIYEVLPKFSHKETGKHLDSKM